MYADGRTLWRLTFTASRARRLRASDSAVLLACNSLVLGALRLRSSSLKRLHAFRRQRLSGQFLGMNASCSIP